MANPLDPLLRVMANEYIDDKDLHRFTGLLFQVTRTHTASPLRAKRHLRLTLPHVRVRGDERAVLEAPGLRRPRACAVGRQ